MTRTPTLLLTIPLVVCSACETRLLVGDPNPYGAPNSGGTATTASSGGAGGGGGSSEQGKASWRWLSPRSTGNHLLAMWALADDDIWIVGEHQTVLHWNGSDYSSRFEPVTSDAFHAVWASSDEDVWIAGPKDLRHWDGSSWTSGYSIASEGVLAIWGSAANDVYFVVENPDRPNELAHWNGSRFDRIFTNHGGAIRDIWGTSATDIWLARSIGSLTHYDGKGWSKVAPVSAMSDDTYVGMWGSSPDDVWAVFQAPGEIGFAWYNGSFLEVVQKLPCGADTQPPRGRRVWGHGSTSLHATVPGCSYAYDGTSWDWANTTSWFDEPLESGAPVPIASLGGTPGRTMGVGRYGRVMAFDPSLPGTGDTWSELTDTRRAELVAVSADDETAWASDGNVLLRWGGKSWTEIAEAPLKCMSAIQSVRSAGGSDVWASGWDFQDGVYSGSVLRWDGAAWSVEAEAAAAVRAIWHSGAEEIWAVGDNGTILRFDGAEWNEMPWGGQEDLHAVVGSSQSDVWILGVVSIEAQFPEIERVVLHWNGATLTEVHRASDTLPTDTLASDGYPVNGIWAGAPNDVWVVGSPGWRYDGAQWTPISGVADNSTVGFWGSGDGVVWAIAKTGTGHEIHRFEGGSASKILASPSRLGAIAGHSTNDVWVAGREGSTLRFGAGTNGTPK